MKDKYIKIFGLNDLSNFVIEATKVKGDVLVYRGKFCVDAKSLMGMMSLNVYEGCRIEYPAEAEEFDKYLTQFEVPI